MKSPQDSRILKKLDILSKVFQILIEVLFVKGLILKIAVCAGEKSGDALGYDLLLDLKKNNDSYILLA